MAPNERTPRRALIAGAGGYLGDAIVRAFVGDGWEVRGLAHSPAAAARADASGAASILGDVLDPGSLVGPSSGCEVIIHVAAANSPGSSDPLSSERVRVEGVRNLLRAARENRVRRLVVGSGYWVYADNPGTIREDSPLDPRGESRINYRTEQVAMDPEGRGPTEVLVARPGMVYGNGSWFRSTVESIREGTYSYVGDGANAWSFVSLEDAGTGFLRVAERGEPGQTYNLVDGRPAAWREFGDFVAQQLSCPPPTSVSEARATATVGPEVAHHLSARRACSSIKLEGLGWTPRFRDFREGIPAILDEILRTGPPNS
jgi:nucleoside-diphosphate-sugar epimerase